jgi:hypothetical protein
MSNSAASGGSDHRHHPNHLYHHRQQQPPSSASSSFAYANFGNGDHHHHPELAGPAATTSAGGASVRMLSTLNSQARMVQIFDEQDHKRCSDGNRKALLAENLDQLRGLVKVIEADDWKYAAPVSSSSSSLFGVSSTSDLFVGGHDTSPMIDDDEQWGRAVADAEYAVSNDM